MTEDKTADILLVEDEKHLHDTLRLNLEIEGYSVSSAFDGVKALEMIDNAGYDLIILDIMIPEIDGIRVLETIRTAGNEVPVLILSAKNSESDRIKGLKTGADDYLVKPFNLEELLLRISNLLQRNHKTTFADEQRIYHFGDNEINFPAQTAINFKGKTFHLSKKEAMLLRLLIQHKGEVVSRDKILHVVWGYNVFPTTRTIDNFILGFRKYFEPDSRAPQFFHSVRGVGYKFTG